ncbi:hypothetical protein HU200_035894 [Digitaria exilis]|uniref:Uncharacterized protein n=1 Tax=Digitaria exilis TaxID=1010633 RepID=A0A835BSS6_9POAL|nr:hypothetical protein HU200_035894 [Digitaria exilis]
MDHAAHVVDIASLAEQIKRELAAADAAAGQLVRGCPIVIAEVGELTRSIDPDEYVPHHVSIGPYHRIKSPHLAMDGEKVRCLGAVLSSAVAGVTLEVYLEELTSLEAQARRCYAHSFDHMDATEFVRMLLLDACYVLVRFAGVLEAAAARRGNGGEAPAASGGGGHMMAGVAVVRDVLYLAENQIPFFVVDKVYNLTVPDSGDSAADEIAAYVRELLRDQQYSVATPAMAEPDEIGNLLHLLHMHFTPTSPSPSLTTGSDVTGGGKRRVGRWRTATEYHSAGVRFRTRPLVGKSARSILDVKLIGGGGTLEIPRLNIDAETWRLLRNLVALEQSNPGAAGGSHHVTAYCVFVSQLACTPWDVELLSRRGVISHGLGSHAEVAELFAGLCKGVAFRADDPRSNYLHATWQAMEGRFRCRPRRWAAWLMLKYFSNPWLAVGLAAAAVGLVCTVVQAVYSVLSYTSGGS